MAAAGETGGWGFPNDSLNAKTRVYQPFHLCLFSVFYHNLSLKCQSEGKDAAPVCRTRCRQTCRLSFIVLVTPCGASEGKKNVKIDTSSFFFLDFHPTVR